MQSCNDLDGAWMVCHVSCCHTQRWMVGWWDGDGSEVSNCRLETETNLGRSGIGIFGRRDPKKNTIIGTLVPLEVKSSLKRMPEDIAYPCLVSI